MKKKITIALLAMVLILTFLPISSVFAQQIITHDLVNITQGKLFFKGDYIGDKTGGEITQFTDLDSNTSLTLERHKKHWTELAEETNIITGQYDVSSTSNLVIEYYDKNKELITTRVLASHLIATSTVHNVKYISIVNTGSLSRTVRQFNFFTYESTFFERQQFDLLKGALFYPFDNGVNLDRFVNLENITNHDNLMNASLLASSGNTTVEYKLIHPVSISNFYFRTGNSSMRVTYLDSSRNVLYQNNFGSNNADVFVEVENISYVQLTNTHGSNHLMLYAFEMYGEYELPEPLREIKNVTSNLSANFIELNYDIPSNLNFSHLEIIKNGITITNSHTDNYFYDTDVLPNTTYNYIIRSHGLDGEITEGYYINVKTSMLEVLSNIQNVNVSKTETSITFNYDLPKESMFSHIEIYKNEELYFPNYQENVFKDTNLQSDTKYTYKFVSVSKDGEKTNGKTIDVRTEKYETEIKGLTQEIDSNGDYIFSWTSPTSGQVKIFVAGEEFQIVEASTKSIKIPSSQMTYDVYGQPRVTLQAISPEGETGKIIDGSSTDGKSPLQKLKDTIFTPLELLKTGMGILTTVGSFVLLGLAFIWYKPLLALIHSSVGFIRNYWS